MTEGHILASIEDEIDLVSLARRAWRFRWTVAAVTCVVPIVVALALWLQPSLYAATATVIIMPSTLMPSRRTDVTPLDIGPLSKEGYTQEAGLPLVLKALQRRLQTGGIPVSVIDRRGALTANADDTMPWVRLTVRAVDPSHAREVANFWAAALMGVDSTSGEARKQKAIAPVLVAHTKAASEISRVERELRAVQERHLRARAQLEFSVNEGQKSMTLASKVERALELENEIARTKAALEDTEERIAQLERERKDMPGFLSLGEHLSLERASLRGLQAKEAILQTQLRDIKAEIDTLRREVNEAKLTLARLAMQHEHETAVLDRAAIDARTVYENLLQRYPEVVDAREVPRSYLKLGAPAPLPRAPEPRSYTIALLALPLALFVSVGCAFMAAVVLESKNLRIVR